MGSDFIRRWNGGLGPFREEYWHSYADEELREVTIGRYLWQRRDLTHLHEHHLRHGKPEPDYMKESYRRFQADGAIFRQRKVQGFPGHEPLTESIAA